MFTEARLSYQKHRTCERKKWYAEEVKARESAKDLMIRKLRENNPILQMFVYQCNYCDGWHKTHKPTNYRPINIEDLS